MKSDAIIGISLSEKVKTVDVRLDYDFWCLDFLYRCHALDANM